MRKFIFIFMLLFTTVARAAHFETLVEVTLKIEDPNMYTRVKNVKFDGNDIILDDPDMFKPRKLLTQKLTPGRYMINWSTEKSNPKWSEQPVINNERILVIEGGDTAVKINIRGDIISLY